MSMVILSEDEARDVRRLLLDLQQTATSGDAARISEALLPLYPPQQRAWVEQKRARLAEVRR